MATYTLNVTNANGNDGDMVFRQYSSFNLSSGNTLNMSNDSRGCIIIVDGDATINGTIKVRGGYGGTPADTSWIWGWIKSGQTGSANNTTSDFGNGSTDGNGILSDLSTFMSKMPQTSSNSYNYTTSAANATMGGSAPNAGKARNPNEGSPYSGGAGNAGTFGGFGGTQRYGGRGGVGNGGGSYALGGGGGNPGGGNGGHGTGGLFIMAARGNISGSGTINCNADGAGGNASGQLYAYGGGGAGGGKILLIAGGTISSSITGNVSGKNGGNVNNAAYFEYAGQSGESGSFTKVAGVGV